MVPYDYRSLIQLNSGICESHATAGNMHPSKGCFVRCAGSFGNLGDAGPLGVRAVDTVNCGGIVFIPATP